MVGEMSTSRPVPPIQVGGSNTGGKGAGGGARGGRGGSSVKPMEPPVPGRDGGRRRRGPASQWAASTVAPRFPPPAPRPLPGRPRPRGATGRPPPVPRCAPRLTRIKGQPTHTPRQPTPLPAEVTECRPVGTHRARQPPRSRGNGGGLRCPRRARAGGGGGGGGVAPPPRTLPRKPPPPPRRGGAPAPLSPVPRCARGGQRKGASACHRRQPRRLRARDWMPAGPPRGGRQPPNPISPPALPPTPFSGFYPKITRTRP